MRRPTIQVPLLRQPPVYMVLAVVLVALLPLGLQLFGAQTLQPEPAAPPMLAAQAALTRLDLEPLRPRCRTAKDGELESLEEVPELDEEEPLDAIAMALDGPRSEDEDVEVLIIEEVSEPPAGEATRRRRPASARGLLGKAKRAYARGKAKAAYQLAGKSARKRPTSAARVVQAKAACELRNKGAARSAYRDLPLGAKRRDVRRSCREHGILLL